MRCLHESMSSREERAEMKRRRVLMRIERKGEEGALRACVCLCVWAMKRSGETRRGSRCEPESVDPARSHQHWYQINSQTLKLIDLLLRHWWTWWSECCRWRGGFKVSHKPHKTTCFDQGKRGSFRGTPSSTRRRSAYADPQSSVILNPRLLQNNHHYIYLPDKWQQNAQSFTTRVHVQT